MPASQVVAVDVDGMIHPVTTEIVRSAILRATETHSALVIVRLNTPGGLMDAMRTTIQQIAASPVPVVTYVSPAGSRAASAGFFILEAGDVAAMAPGTNTGAAHPVAMFGEMDPEMKEKVVNDAAASMRSITTAHARNSTLAESAVRESKSFTEREALAQHLVEIVAATDEELLRALDGRTITLLSGRTVTLHTAGLTVVTYRPTLRQRIVAAIADPNIALILLVLGALAIYIEFTSPGLVAPGVVGAILVLLGLSALSVLPINWLGVALLILAGVLFALEAKLAAHGVLGVGATVSLVLGSVLLVDSPFPEMRVHWSTAIALAVPFSLITAFLLSLVVRARRNKVETGSSAMVGLTGSAVSALEPEGKVFVHGEYWDAVSLKPAPAGARIRVTAIDGLRLSVEPVPDRRGE